MSDIPITADMLKRFNLDEATLRSALQASTPTRNSQAKREALYKRLDDPDSIKPASTVATLAMRSRAVNHRLVTDRITMLERIKFMGVGEFIVVPYVKMKRATDKNPNLPDNARAACQYQKKTYGKNYRTEKFLYDRNEYLKVMRIAD